MNFRLFFIVECWPEKMPNPMNMFGSGKDKQ